MSTPSHIYCALVRPHAPALHTTFRSCLSPMHVALQHPLLLLRPPNSSSGASSRDCTSQPTTGLPPLLMSHLSMGHRSKHIHQVCSNIYFQQLHHRGAHRSLWPNKLMACFCLRCMWGSPQLLQMVHPEATSSCWF